MTPQESAVLLLQLLCFLSLTILLMLQEFESGALQTLTRKFRDAKCTLKADKLSLSAKHKRNPHIATVSLR